MLKKLVELVADIVHEFGKLLKFGLAKQNKLLELWIAPCLRSCMTSCFGYVFLESALKTKVIVLKK